MHPPHESDSVCRKVFICQGAPASLSRADACTHSDAHLHSRHVRTVDCEDLQWLESKLAKIEADTELFKTIPEDNDKRQMHARAYLPSPKSNIMGVLARSSISFTAGLRLFLHYVARINSRTRK